MLPNYHPGIFLSKEQAMNRDMIRFSDAVYLKKEKYDFESTEFTRRELKVLLLIDGTRTVSEIAELLSADPYPLMPSFAKLIMLGLIQTDGGIISGGVNDIFFSDSESFLNNSPVEYHLPQMPITSY